jgi:hypothetical protein
VRARAVAGALTAVVVAGALAACTGAPASPSTSGAPATPTTIAAPSSIPNDPALRHDVAMTSCAATKGGWGARGRIVNGSREGHDYRITVLFTTSAASVIGAGDATVHVAAGATGDWTITAPIASAPTALCVLAGVA